MPVAARGQGGAKRAVAVPGGAAAVARRIATRESAWCWLDGGAPAPGETSTSYCGIASEVRIAESGRERAFLAGLGSDHPHSGTAGSGFSSGWIVALGYEFGVALLGLDPAPDDAEPGFALRLDVVLAVTGEQGELRGGSERELDAWMLAHGDVLSGAGDAAFPAGAGAGQRAPAPASAVWRRSDSDYISEVETCKAAITAGDAYVLCLTDTAELRGDFDPLALFERLRVNGPASRGAVIVTPDRSLVSTSPERFLSVHSGRIATHPIKGTRPRGATSQLDAGLARELAADPKERAENLMIVDLLRNDLAQVCVPGSVAVSGFLRVETHPHVHQLVSTVSGQLAGGRGIADALATCFPGGSMTGAPKRSAVEILAGLEAGPRGLYAGCFGWIDDRGDAELAMTIRGVELRPGRALVGAGGGITADSVPENEVREKHLKAGALLAALRD